MITSKYAAVYNNPDLKMFKKISFGFFDDNKININLYRKGLVSDFTYYCLRVAMLLKMSILMPIYCPLSLSLYVPQCNTDLCFFMKLRKKF